MSEEQTDRKACPVATSGLSSRGAGRRQGRRLGLFVAILFTVSTIWPFPCQSDAYGALIAQAAHRLVKLEALHRDRTRTLAALQEQMGELGIAFQRLARQPHEAILTAPGSPLDTARASMLIRHLMTVVAARTGRIDDERLTLAAERRVLDLARTRFEAAESAFESSPTQSREPAEIGQRLQLAAGAATVPADRDPPGGSVLPRSAIFDTVMRHSTALDAAMDALVDVLALAEPADVESDRRTSSDREPRDATAMTPVPDIVPPRETSLLNRKGKLTFPAVGTITERFGEAGAEHGGIALLTGVDAAVLAPYDGVVQYAGAFHGYGHVVLIDHAAGFRTLLAGLGRVTVRTGQRIVEGAPVGNMAGSERQKPVASLHVEFRQNGKPVDPLAWLSSGKGSNKR